MYYDQPRCSPWLLLHFEKLLKRGFYCEAVTENAI